MWPATIAPMVPKPKAPANWRTPQTRETKAQMLSDREAGEGPCGGVEAGCQVSRNCDAPQLRHTRAAEGTSPKQTEQVGTPAYKCTTKQVVVLVMPSISCTRLTTIFPRESTSAASARAITS